MSKDPLLQPYQLKHLTLKNRIMTTSHEPAYPEDGMPKERYRAYHEERAKAGVALAMTAGSKLEAPVTFPRTAFKAELLGWFTTGAKAMADEALARARTAVENFIVDKYLNV